MRSLEARGRADQDKASGTQLIQELIGRGPARGTRYQPPIDKVMRMQAQRDDREGFVHYPNRQSWDRRIPARADRHLPKGKHDDRRSTHRCSTDASRRPRAAGREGKCTDQQRAQAGRFQPRGPGQLSVIGKRWAHPVVMNGERY